MQGKELLKKKRLLEQKLRSKGYSIKRINGHEYIYTWWTTGHAKAKWKCLGRYDISGGEDFLRSLQKKRLDGLLEEYYRLMEEFRDAKTN